jgi:hypothetical protein
VYPALTRLPFDYENAADGGESSEEAVLRSGWSNDHRSRVALIETALTHCDPGGQVSLEEHAEYDENQARFLLRTRGMVDVNDFLGDEEQEDGFSNEVGWNVKITFRAMTLSQAAGHIAKAMKILNQEVEQVERLRHSALCLLRKADPSSIKYARETWDYRHTDYPSGGSKSSVMFKIPDHDNTPVEFQLSTFYEVH